MRFEYFRNDGCVALANINMVDVIAEITDDDLVLELDATGIILNRFMPRSAEKDETKIIVWINLETEEISVQRTGFSKMQNDKFIEDVKFTCTAADEMALIEYIQK